MKVVVFVLVLLVKSIIAVTYQEVGSCRENTCVYDYTSTCNLHNNNRAKEEVQVEATVYLKCDSVGQFNSTHVTKYCIDVKNVTTTMYEINADNEKTVQDAAGNRSETDGENSLDSKFSQEFCFIRNENGKILTVFYPKGEEPEIVNIKKAIASAFQANFAETETEEELDTQSRHKSHYTYEQKGDKRVEHRVINREDIAEYSGHASKAALDTHTEEDIEIGDQNTIYHSHGQNRIGLVSKTKDNTNEDETDNTDADQPDVAPPLEANTSYSLDLRECLAVSLDENEDAGGSSNGQSSSRNSRSAKNAKLRQRKMIMGDLMAKWDIQQQRAKEIEELRESLPDLHDTARQISRRNADKEKDKMMGKHISKWKQILYLESNYHGTPLGEPKIVTLKKLLNKQIDIDSEEATNLRNIIYSLLSFEGSLTAQKTLIQALNYCSNKEEKNIIILALSMLTSVHTETMSELQKYMETNPNDDQILLAYATLGRHDNVQDEVVGVVVNRLADLMETGLSTNDTTELIYLIHALGNTGSKKIAPYIAPFLLSSNLEVQLAAIDATRTISREETIQKIYNNILKDEASIEIVAAIVDSLIFPFEHSIYFFDATPQTGNQAVEKDLIKSIIKITAEYKNLELTKLVKSYLQNVEKDFSENYIQTLNVKLNQQLRIRKRSHQTTNWNSNANSNYNLIASLSSRTNDETNYPYHKAYLWTKQLGPSKVHAKIALGGFGGVGATGYKLFAKGIVKLYAYGITYTAFEAKYLNQKSFVLGTSTNRYVKICGSTYLQKSGSVSIPYTYNWGRNLYSIHLFYKQSSVFIWVGTLNLYIGSKIDIKVTLGMTVNPQDATAVVDFGPILSVYGGASATVLIFWKIGLEVDARIGYFVSPTSSITFCDDDPVGDATACFGIYHGSKGIDIDLYAYYQKRKCKISWWKITCWWGPKNKVGSLSTTFTLGSALTQSLLWGKCAACSCPGSALNTYCTNPYGILQSGTTSSCTCSIANIP